MTEKHRLAISRGLRKLRKRRRLSAAMKASWVRRRQTENAPEVRNNNHEPSSQSVETSTKMLTILSEVWQQGYNAALVEIQAAVKQLSK